MPELPEVEVLREKLENLLKGRRIVDVEVYDSSRISGLNPASLRGEVVLGVGRRGKHLYIELSSGDKLVFHLRLNGRLVYGHDNDDLQNPWIKIDFDTGRSLFFGDVRRMATLDCVRDLSGIGAIADMGPEPFDSAFSLEYFKEKLTKSGKSIKALLMDQSFVAGIGNIYADEILYRAGIHPERRANKLSASEMEKLYISIKDILREAIEHKGVGKYTSLSPEDKDVGNFENSLRVHGREGEPCLRCRAKIARIKIGGRGTYFCPKCQA